MSEPPRWWVYLLRCADGTLYTGISTNPDRRLTQHNAGTASHGSRGNNLDNVRSIVEAHGGTVRVANCPEGGVAYTLHFPGHAARRAA